MKSCAQCGEPFEYKGKGKKSYCPPCNREYQRRWRAANPTAVRQHKAKWKAEHPDEVREAKRRRYHADLDRSREVSRAWRARNPELVKAQQERRRVKDNETGRGILYRYGITLEQRAELVEKQGGLCALCPTPLGELPTRQVHHDHDHATGLVRGILCYSCNLRLGWYESRMTEVANYLAGPHMVPANRRARALLGEGPVQYQRW